MTLSELAKQLHDAAQVQAEDPPDAGVARVAALLQSVLQTRSAAQTEAPLTVVLTEEELCALEKAEVALRAIAERSILVEDRLEPVANIGEASKRAKYALKRLEPLMRKLDKLPEPPVGHFALSLKPTYSDILYAIAVADLPENRSTFLREVARIWARKDLERGFLAGVPRAPGG